MSLTLQMMSPVPGRCDHLLHCESVVCIPGNALWSAPKRGQARIGSAAVRLQLRGTVSHRFSEDHEALLERDRCLMGQPTKWGNCSPLQNLSFNWRLIMAPETVLRYLVTHEAVHLAVPDHSQE